MRAAPSSTSSAWSPAGACRSCRRGSCGRTRRSVRARRIATSRPAQVDDEIVKALLAGRVVPVLGLAGSAALAERLATAFDYPRDRPLDLARVCQYVATMRGAGRLWDELHDRFEAAIEPEPIHRLLASLPPLLRERGVPHQLIVTTNYDLGLERAFEEAEEELDVVAYVASGPNQGRFWHRPPGEPPRPVEVPNAYTELSLDERTVLLKLRGAVDPHPEREWESFVATEDDHIEFLGRSELATAVPVTLAARLRRSHFLFFGYEMADWNLRLVLNRVWGGRTVVYGSWAAQPSPSALERAFWRHYDVDVLDIEPDALVRCWPRVPARRHQRECHRDRAVPRPQLLRRVRPRRTPVLRARAGRRDRRRQPGCLAAHRALRAKRRRQVVAAPRGRRPVAARAPGAAAGRRVRALG